MSGTQLIIVVDRERCMGSGVCSFHAPNTFDLDDECKSFVVGVNDPEESIRNAVESCPQRAISVAEADATA